jgi:hypothetical protein
VGARGIELAGGVGDLLLAFPDAEGLRDLLVQGHAREEIPHALVHRARAIAVERGVLRERGKRGAESQNRGHPCKRFHRFHLIRRGLYARTRPGPGAGRLLFDGEMRAW